MRLFDREMLRLILIILFIFSCEAHAEQARDRAVVYVCAHPDDCTLFMNPNLFNDIKDVNARVHIIYITSGDAGEKWDSSLASYPKAREVASLESTRWVLGLNNNNKSEVQGNRSFAGKGIHVVSQQNVTSYFLRIPDGGMYGEGFALYQHSSLKKLKNGEIGSISAIDSSANYKGWESLKATIGKIILDATAYANDIEIHLAEQDLNHNINDHSDHIHAANLVLEAVMQARPQKCYRIYSHKGYVIRDLAANLQDIDIQNKSGSFAVMTNSLRHNWGSNDWNEAHISFLSRNYYNIRNQPDNCNK